MDFESIPLWAVTLIGGLFITVLSFIMIMSVYGRFFDCIFTQRLHRFHYLHLQESRVRISEEVFEVIRSSVSGGAIVVLACIIFSLFASSPPVVNPDAAVVTMVWSYIGELIFNMLVLVSAVKMSDRVVRK